MPRLVVEATHLDQLREHGGLSGLRNEHGLEAALARPKQKWHFDPKVDLALLAASYAFGLSTAHAFSDGNKRIVLAVIDVFLRINGSGLTATEEDAADTIRRLAAGELTESDLAAWISANQA